MLDAQLLELGDALRREGVAIGTSELLDAFSALDEVPWTEPEDFREALAATLAKSPDDRRLFELVFDRFFFRATEAAAVRAEIREGGAGGTDGFGEGDQEINLDTVAERAGVKLGGVLSAG